MAQKLFSYMRQIHNWLHHSMLMELSVNIAIIPVHCHTILTLKADRCNAYMNHLCRMMASSLFIGSWFVRCLYIFIHWNDDLWTWTCLGDCFFSDFLQNLSQTPSRHTTSYDIVRRLIDVETTSCVYCRSGAIIFIVLQDLWNYIQFNLLVAIL